MNDIRESPSLVVMERLARSGAACSYYDPYVPTAQLLDEQLASQPLDPRILERQDCVAILTDHDTVDYAAVILSAPLVVDARGVTRKLLKAPNLVLL